MRTATLSRKLSSRPVQGSTLPGRTRCQLQGTITTDILTRLMHSTFVVVDICRPGADKVRPKGHRRSLAERNRCRGLRMSLLPPCVAAGEAKGDGLRRNLRVHGTRSTQDRFLNVGGVMLRNLGARKDDLLVDAKRYARNRGQLLIERLPYGYPCGSVLKADFPFRDISETFEKRRKPL
jgi:hypothetical protein